jgi:hypothetical protein
LRLKNHYKRYCNILSKVIKEVKRYDYNNQILKSNNKTKTIWEIVKLETGKRKNNKEVQSLNIDGQTTNNTQTIANAFNDYFLSLAEQQHVNDDADNGYDSSRNNIHKNDDYSNNNGNDANVNNGNNGDNDDDSLYTPIHYLVNAINKNFPNTKIKPTTQEIEIFIKPLKPKNTFGYNEISTKLLKLSSVYISSPLNHKCNSSILSGKFPQCLKYSTVRPLYKKRGKGLHFYLQASIHIDFILKGHGKGYVQ